MAAGEGANKTWEAREVVSHRSRARMASCTTPISASSCWCFVRNPRSLISQCGRKQGGASILGRCMYAREVHVCAGGEAQCAMPALFLFWPSLHPPYTRHLARKLEAPDGQNAGGTHAVNTHTYSKHLESALSRGIQGGCRTLEQPHRGECFRKSQRVHCFCAPHRRCCVCV